jgi:hypothetical protein
LLDPDIGHLTAGNYGRFVYDGTYLVLLNPATLAAGQQIARNGSFAIAQRSMPTTDNAYCLDGWRLLMENANGVVVSQITGDVPLGAGYACQLVVGSGNNGKFGIFSPIENKDMLHLRGGVCSLRTRLKATAGLTDGTGKIRQAILYWTGTADSVASDPISSWGAEGTNPTLSGSWNYANTPAAIAVTTTWDDYLLENVSIPSNATNIAIFIWSDDRGTTTTTDYLLVGGGLTLTQGAYAAPAIILAHADELQRAQRYFETGSWVQYGANGGDGGLVAIWANYHVRKRTAPTTTTNVTFIVTGASIRTGKLENTTGDNISGYGVSTTSGTFDANGSFTADADL